MLDGVCTRQWKHPETFSDKIDRVLTHRLVGTMIFAAVMFLLFSSIFVFAKPLMDWIAAGAQLVQDSGRRQLCPKVPCDRCWSMA